MTDMNLAPKPIPWGLFRPTENPWGLSKAEARAFDAYTDAGNTKGAAKLLKRTPETVSSHLKKGGQKMGTPPGDQLIKYLLWDRFRQAQKVSAP